MHPVLSPPVRKDPLHLIGLLCGLLTVALWQYGCSPKPDPEAVATHQAQITAQRQAKNHFFRTSANSPLLPEQVAGFTGLSYFPPDYAYRVSARFEPSPTPEPVQIHASGGETRRYHKVGQLFFTVSGERCTLAAYQSATDQGTGHLFVPFTDNTSGRETYGGGRYLEVETPVSTSSVVLDFNLAYNPYCAYNYHYSCPTPPRENHLPVAINAGEKIFPLQTHL